MIKTPDKGFIIKTRILAPNATRYFHRHTTLQ